MTARMKIGELARRTQCAVQTIRYYESAGLLSMTQRSQGNFRLYGPVEVARLVFIRHCRGLDMTLAEIRSLLRFRDAPDENCSKVNVLLDEHIGHVAERIEELGALQRQLRQLRRLCRRTQQARDCGILNELADGGRDDRSAANAIRERGHVSGTHRRRIVDKPDQQLDPTRARSLSSKS